jgi:hypothetical protein
MKRLNEEIDFRELSEDDVWAFLGGIFPEERGRIVPGSAPWASVSSAFLLRPHDSNGPQTLSLSIAIPPRDELFPFVLELFLNGQPTLTHRLDAPTDAVQRLAADVPQHPANDGPIEVRLETESYFCEIDDHRMKSFQLLSARVDPR